MLCLSPVYAILHSFKRFYSVTQFKGFNSVKRLHLLQKTSLRKMFFQSRNSHTGPLFKVSKIRKSFDKTTLENCIFISKSLKGLLPSIFIKWFKFSFESHSHDTRWLTLRYLKIASYRTKSYGRYSMFVNLIHVWNYLQSSHQNIIFHHLRANEFKEVLISYALNRYN